MTPEHKASPWHVYNVKVTSEQGKTPLSHELYVQFEAPRLTGNTAPVSAEAVPAHLKSTNVRSWHWEEKDCTTVAKANLKSALLETKIDVQKGTLTITEVTDVTGDCTVRIRRGKPRVGWELHVKLKWTGTIAGPEGPLVSVEGTVELPDVCSDEDCAEYEISKLVCEAVADTDTTAEGCKAMLTVFKASGIPALRAACQQWRTELTESITSNYNNAQN